MLKFLAVTKVVLHVVCTFNTIKRHFIIEGGSVVAYETICNKNYESKNSLIGGVTGKILKTNITWNL